VVLIDISDPAMAYHGQLASEDNAVVVIHYLDTSDTQKAVHSFLLLFRESFNAIHYVITLSLDHFQQIYFGGV
jgi:hypothetical protein